MISYDHAYEMAQRDGTPNINMYQSSGTCDFIAEALGRMTTPQRKTYTKHKKRLEKAREALVTPAKRVRGAALKKLVTERRATHDARYEKLREPARVLWRQYKDRNRERAWADQCAQRDLYSQFMNENPGYRPPDIRSFYKAYALIVRNDAPKKGVLDRARAYFAERKADKAYHAHVVKCGDLSRKDAAEYNLAEEAYKRAEAELWGDIPAIREALDVREKEIEQTYNDICATTHAQMLGGWAYIAATILFNAD